MELLFPGSDHDNSYGKMDAFTRLFYDHVFRERRLQQLQHRYLLQEENEFGVIRREKDERDPLVIPKSRDGLSYLSGFQTFQMQNMKTEPRVKQKPRDKLERQIINQFSTAAEIKDHSGKFYFSLLDQNWDSISREHMLSLEAVVKDPPPLLRHYDEACKSFTIIYSDPYKLDLRCRSLQYAQTRVFNSSTLERLKTSSDRLAYEERFKNFLKCHDNNINQLQILSSGFLYYFFVILFRI